LTNFYFVRAAFSVQISTLRRNDTDAPHAIVSPLMTNKAKTPYFSHLGFVDSVAAEAGLA
jgi:hypothetical protein